MFQSPFVVNSGRFPEDSVHTNRAASRIGTVPGHSATAGPALNPSGIGRRGGCSPVMLAVSRNQRLALLHMNRSLSIYGQRKGSVGIYFYDQLEVGDWKDRLGQSGIRNYVVESEIVGKPNLPNFELQTSKGG